MRHHRPTLSLLTISLLLAGCTPDDGVDSGVAPTNPLDSCPVDEVLRSGMQLDAVRLDLACQGQVVDGVPTVLMLHGFPEFWMGWAPVMDRLSAHTRVIAPDQRGYNTSDKPQAIDDYALELLVGDVVQLIEKLDGPVVLVGHDWGGGVAWAVAAWHPELIDRLVIMNAPHMNVFGDLLATDEAQQEAFSYVDFFVAEGSEDLLVANDFGILSGMFEGVLTEAELADYKEAWGQDRAIEGGLNWYRANFEDGLPKVEGELIVDVPTLVLWGMEDTALLPSNLDGLPAYVDDLEIQEVAGATHWIAHEEPDLVASAISGFMD